MSVGLVQASPYHQGSKSALDCQDIFEVFLLDFLKPKTYNRTLELSEDKRLRFPYRHSGLAFCTYPRIDYTAKTPYKVVLLKFRKRCVGVYRFSHHCRVVWQSLHHTQLLCTVVTTNLYHHRGLKWFCWNRPFFLTPFLLYYNEKPLVCQGILKDFLKFFYLRDRFRDNLVVSHLC